MTVSTFQTVEYSLPSVWASYFVNNDPSGLEDNDITEANDWWESNFRDEIAVCVDVKDDAEFNPFHDARWVTLPADCSTFVFHVTE